MVIECMACCSMLNMEMGRILVEESSRSDERIIRVLSTCTDHGLLQDITQFDLNYVLKSSHVIT